MSITACSTSIDLCRQGITHPGLAVSTLWRQDWAGLWKEDFWLIVVLLPRREMHGAIQFSSF